MTKKYIPALFTVVFATVLLFSGGCGKGKSSKKKSSKVKAFREEHVIDFDGLKIKFVQVDPSNLWVAKYEISNNQYNKVDPKHHSGYHEGIDLSERNMPVVNVSWKDAQKFCKYLNKTHPVDGERRYTFRLPTEEEWNKFATCNKDTEYPWGAEWPPPENRNYFGMENSGFGMKIQGHKDKYVVAAPVTKAGYNAWGIYGAGGNVKEWCQNPYDIEEKYRTFKDASWVDSHPNFLNTSKRNYYEPDYKYINLGFRVVADVKVLTADERDEIRAELKRKEEQAEAARLRAEKEAEDRARKLKELEARERQEKKLLGQTAVQRLVDHKDYDGARKKLDEYALDFGKDSFYEEWNPIIENTKVVNLGEGNVIEFIKFTPIDMWVGKYEVTNKQFKQVKPDHDSGKFREHSLAEDEQPVVNVSWEDAKSFCKWLNENYADSIPSTHEFRLPTEKEWEKFAGCGEGLTFPWGNDWPPSFGNYGLMQDYNDGSVVTCPVAESGKNKLGMCGVGGNVWEWTEDWFDSTQVSRVFKGAAWNLSRPDALKISNHSGDEPSKKTPYVGFRVVIGKRMQ